MNVEFMYDQRLHIHLPVLHTSWDNLDSDTQGYVLEKWEESRGIIPDRVKELEIVINKKQAALESEMNFEQSCIINSEISEFASKINDLWIWFRLDLSLSAQQKSSP
ncbi:hypothetical protein [Bacillus sp. FJAT-45037]|uniref:hypothetical protein n=1 Tax=Bacillus sp. FJAT-45037 TaxID=2011007 RepID=UPI000C23345F|nr:hypothetical protein [Bacillus sp. FJAT-45037]